MSCESSLSRWNVTIDTDRFNNACRDRHIFHVLDTDSLSPNSLSADLPHLYVLGTTANLYVIHFLPNAITCSCPDQTSPCKHVIFVLQLLCFDPSPGRFSLSMSDCITRFRNSVPFEHNRLSNSVNQICKAFITHPCVTPNETSSGTLYMCDRCRKLMHDLHFNTTDVCPICASRWEPYVSSMSVCGNCRNFHALFKRFQIPVLPLSSSNLDFLHPTNRNRLRSSRPARNSGRRSSRHH